MEARVRLGNRLSFRTGTSFAHIEDYLLSETDCLSMVVQSRPTGDSAVTFCKRISAPVLTAL